MSEDRYVIAEGSGEYPPLLIVFNRRLRQEAIVNFRQSLTDHLATKPKVLIFESADDFTLFQLVNGRWMSLDSTIELEGAPMPEAKKINFHEFL